LSVDITFFLGRMTRSIQVKILYVRVFIDLNCFSRRDFWITNKLDASEIQLSHTEFGGLPRLQLAEEITIKNEWKQE